MLCIGDVNDVRQIWVLSDDEIARTTEAVSALEYPPVVLQTIQLVSVEHLGDLLLETETQ